MRRHIPGVIAIVLAVLAPAGAEELPVAADLPPAERMAARFAEGLRDGLGLTDEQVPRFEAELIAMMRRQREILARQAGDEPSPAAMRELMREIEASQAEAKDNLRDVLSEAQLAAFDRALLDQRAQAVGEGMARRLEEPLGLSPEQRDQAASVFAEHTRRMVEAVAEVRASGRQFGAFRALRERSTAMQHELEQDLSRVLSPEQLARYREVAAELRRPRGRARSPADPG